LELGSGSGAVPKYLAGAGLHPLYIGLDISPAMLRRAAGSSRVVGDAAYPPIAAESIDLVIGRQSFHYFNSPMRVLSEVGRVLAPGGSLIVAQITPFDEVEDKNWWKTAIALRQPLRRHRWTAAGLVEAVGRSGFSVECVRHLMSRSSLANWLDRYDISEAARGEVTQHFHSAPDMVRELRDFKVSGLDIEYTIRWTFILANFEGH
jgi:SAM-dependent methyltransferase